MPNVFIEPARLASAGEDMTIVDVRRADEYEAGHISGACHVPFERFRDPGDETEGKLPTAEAFGTLLGEAGVAPGDRIVAYDGDRGVYASRFLVTAEVFGHAFDRLHVLDGDIEVWKRAYETTTAVPSPRSTTYECRLRADGPLVDAAEVDAEIDDAVIVDTRDELEYDTVHLPGAVNLQWDDLVDDAARQLKRPGDIDAILRDHGLRRGKPIRLYCNTARRLSFVYAVLRARGYDDVAIYEGGIAGWARYGGAVETTTRS